MDLRSAPDEVRDSLVRTPLTLRPRRVLTLLLAIVGLVVSAVALLAVFSYFTSALGGGGVVLAAVLALVPLTFVMLGVRWIDRWDPEPFWVVLFAFLWGAGVSVLIALVVDGQLQSALGIVAQGQQYEVFQATIQAPVVEEGAKGIGVLLLLWTTRRHFDGPVDGLVYSTWVAGGFAFTENIQYFALEITDPEGDLGSVTEMFFVRGLMSPFAHVMFTACIGIALGLARRHVGALGALGFFLAGLIPAVLLHALWNGALYVVADFYAYYLLVQVPLLLGAIGIAAWLRRSERRLTLARLGDYAAAGWFHPTELDVIATRHGRRAVRAWARGHGVQATVDRYIQDATRLAFVRERMRLGEDLAAAQASETELLARIIEARRVLSGDRAGGGGTGAGARPADEVL